MDPSDDESRTVYDAARESPDVSGCPTEEELAGYAAGRVSGTPADEIGAHLTRCERCRSWLREAEADEALFRSVCPSKEPGPGEESVESKPGHADSKDVGVNDTPGSYPEIKGYEITEEVGHGAQGVVYRAVQLSTKRSVAIKLQLAEPRASTPSARRRFEREIELAATLSHQNIVSVFDSGMTADGKLFCVMDYAQGVPLGTYAQGADLTVEGLLQQFCDVCEAVNYAHQRGVIHRDLKPSNIVVDSQGRPKILDFGLAKLLGGEVETQLSLTGQVLGTLPYASPEQARGDPGEIDIRTDVYSLGVILYELLTGRYPYPVTGPAMDVLKHITDTPPTPPTRSWTGDSGVTKCTSRRIRSGECPITDELETIVLKTLSKERERRYQSAGELARDIRHYLAGEPIEAKRDRRFYVLRKTLQPYRVHVILGAVCAAVITISTYTMWNLLQSRARENDLLLREAQYQIAIGAYRGALAKLDELVQRDPSMISARLLHARVLTRLGRADEAIDYWQRILAQRPDCWQAHCGLAQLLADRDPEQAARHLNKVQALAPQTAEALFAQSLAEEDDEAALSLLTRALELEPAHHDALFRRAWVHYRVRDYQAMRLDAERLVGAQPEDHKSFVTRGVALAKLQDNSASIADFTRSIFLNSSDASAYYNRGNVKMRMGRYAEALEDYEACLSLKPSHWKALENSAVAKRILGDFDGAVAAFRRFLKVVRGRPLYHAYLYLCLHDAEMDTAARETLEEAIQSIDDPSTWKAKILQFLANDLSEDELLTLAGEDYGKLCEAQYFAGERRLHDGDVTGARRLLEQSVATGKSTYVEFRFAKARLSDSPMGLARVDHP